MNRSTHCKNNLDNENQNNKETVPDAPQTKKESAEKFADFLDKYLLDHILTQMSGTNPSTHSKNNLDKQNEIKKEPVPDTPQIKKEPVPDTPQIKKEPVPDTPQIKKEPVPDTPQIKKEQPSDSVRILENSLLECILSQIFDVHPSTQSKNNLDKKEPVPDTVHTNQEPVPDTVHTNQDQVEDTLQNKKESEKEEDTSSEDFIIISDATD